MSLLSVHNLDIVFGPKPETAFPFIDMGATRKTIREKTGNTVAISGASLSIQPGEILVLMGLSGSGKSSLLRAFNGLNKASRGQVCFKDQPITDFKSLRRQEISMVFQAPALLPWRTVSENVGFGLEIAKEDPTKRSKIIFENLERVGLEQWADNMPSQLSGGMQQRVGIARALAMGTRVLLMDEPFSALDPLTRSQLQQELLKLQKELNKTILFVTHDLSEALLLGNRIALLEEGRIIQLGTPREITQNPINAHVQKFVGNAQQHCPRCGDQAFA